MAVVCLAVLLIGAGEPHRVEIDFSSSERLVWTRGSPPALLTRPLPGEGWIALARRYSGTSDTARRIRAANAGLEHPLRDRSVRIPLEVLRADLRLAATRRLFPADRRVAFGWEHWVLDPFGGGEESWEWLAELFCGRPGAADDLRRANPELAAEGLRRARPIVVPAGSLLAVFRGVEPVATPTPSPTPTPRASPTPGGVRTPTPVPGGGALEFGSDDEGDYAVYRLRRGEALYSAVVVRFTGQLHAPQVNATALEIAERSGIRDVTAIPVGYPIKIPLDLLLPENLPAGHPRRRAWELEQTELARFLEVVRAADLTGVHVILDAGHGGRDTGAVVDGVWESTYAYDIMCRVKANLERHTRATVWVLREDPDVGFAAPSSDRLAQTRNQVLLTDPPYALEDSTAGVHLRWYLTNDIITRRLGRDVPRSRTVFLSVHVDSLHPSVRGAMVYVPSRHMRPDSYTVRSRNLRRYREYRSSPTVNLSAQFKAKAEASSRYMAGRIVRALERNEIGVHPYEPVRDRVLRGRHSWVPAVLRYSLAQNAVLVEACNMANDEDRDLLLDHQWRERFARAVVEGVADAFGDE